MTRRLLSAGLIVAFLAFGALPAFAQTPTEQGIYLLADGDADYVYVPFREPVIDADRLFILIEGEDGLIATWLQLAGVDLSRWTPTSPPAGTIDATWSIDPSVTVHYRLDLDDAGGVDAIMFALPPGTVDRLGTLSRIEAGPGTSYPYFVLRAADEYLPTMTTIDDPPAWDVGFTLTTPEGDAGLQPELAPVDDRAATSPTAEPAPADDRQVGWVVAGALLVAAGVGYAVWNVGRPDGSPEGSPHPPSDRGGV